MLVTSASDIDGCATVPLDSDITCQRCGYMLRGVGGRCPECGAPFDPADHVNTFTARWPRLLALFLGAMALSAAVRMWEHVRGHEWATGRLPDAFDPWLYRFIAVATLMLGATAAWGLYRRQDWGRKVALVLLGVLVVAGLAQAVSREVENRRYVPNLPANIPQWLRDVVRRRAVRNNILDTALASLAPVCLMGAGLTTGMRRHSLARPPNAFPPPLPLARYGVRNDWTGLMAVLLVGIALAQVPYLARVWPDLIRPGVTWDPATTIIGRIAWLLPKYRVEFTLVWGLAGAAAVWWRPGWARWVTLSLLAVTAGEELFRGAVAIMGAGQAWPRAPWGSGLEIMQRVSWLLCDIAPLAALHLFARRA